MIKSDEEILERKINIQICKQLQTINPFVLREVRLHPCEMDIIVLDPNTLLLTALEIKRNKWRELLQQATRAKLYCHFSLAVMPNSKRDSIPLDDFLERGIGIVFYKRNGKKLDLLFDNKPQYSTIINRTFKQQIYLQFQTKYGEII